MRVVYGAALALPRGTAAQQLSKVWRIGHVDTSTPEIGAIFAQALEQRLADLGYVQGRNIVLLHRFAGPQPYKLVAARVGLPESRVAEVDDTRDLAQAKSRP